MIELGARGRYDLAQTTEFRGCEGTEWPGSELVSLEPDQREKIKPATATIRFAILIPVEFSGNAEAPRLVCFKYLQDRQLT